MKIPKAIQDLADSTNCNWVSFIGVRKGKDAFMMGHSEENEDPIICGLPIIYLFDGKTIETIGGEEALKLL